MDAIAIADPRKFPAIDDAPAADGEIYALARRMLDGATSRDVEPLAHRLRAAIAARLRDDGPALAALFSGAPSVDVARALWRTLDDAWRDAVVASGELAVTIFAIPIVVVVGSTGERDGALAGVLRDAGALDALLREHGALRGNRTLALADALVVPDAIDIARLPDVLSWHRLDRRDGGLRELVPGPIAYARGVESVHARCAIGSAVAAAGIDLLQQSPRSGWAMPFTRELARQLAVPDATVLALPAAPAYPLAAVRQARAAQREIAAQMFASNALRAIRGRSGEPVAIVSAHRAADAPGGGELRVSLSSPFEPRDAEGFRCPLYPLDRVDDVARMLTALLRDCRVADVRIVAGVHGDRIGDTAQPLLFKPDTLPADAPTLH